MSVIGGHSLGRSLIASMRSHPLLRYVVDLLLGYRRTFAAFAEAQACSSRYIDAGHEHTEEISQHVAFSSVVRESDYPVLFFLSDSSHGLRTIFDLGGNVGNLFYAYQRYLKFSDDLIWMVLDLPAQKSFGERFAAEKNERRIRYVDSFAAASGVDLFISSGSLHYFEPPLSEMLGQLTVLPHRVVVNRTPCSSVDDLVTVQEGKGCLVPCKLHSKNKLIEGMQNLGYELRGEWPVHERKLWVPLYPDYSSSHYSGFYFERI